MNIEQATRLRNALSRDLQQLLSLIQNYSPPSQSRLADDDQIHDHSLLRAGVGRELLLGHALDVKLRQVRLGQVRRRDHIDPDA